MIEDRPPDHRFRYREVSPPADVSHLAFCFFEFSIEHTGINPIPYEVVPDGFVSFLCRINARNDASMLLVRGLSLESFATSVMPGDVHWGLRLSPAANRKVLGCDPKTVPTRPFNDSSFLGHISSGLKPDLVEARTFEQACEVFASFLKRLEIDKEHIEAAVSDAVDETIRSYGRIKITDLAANLGINKRRLERSFRREVGFTPKQYSRVFRLRSTAISLIEEDRMNWANRAAEMGFADQSHLIKEFVALTGRTPKGFSSKLEHTDYGKFVR